MPFSLLVLDASEPRQTGMDIWRESGNRLAVLMPAPQKHSYTHEHAHTHTPTQTHISVLLRIRCPELWAVPTSCCPIISEPAPYEHRGNFGTSSISHHPSRPRAGIQDEGWTPLCTRKCPPIEREDGTADKGKSGEHTASTKLCSKNSPAWIASLPHISVSVSSASHGYVSAHFVCVVWCLCWQLAWKSFPRVTGWVLCETEKYYWEARLTLRLLAAAEQIIFSHIGLSPTGLCLLFHTVAVLKVGVVIRAFYLNDVF